MLFDALTFLYKFPIYLFAEQTDMHIFRIPRLHPITLIVNFPQEHGGEHGLSEALYEPGALD